MIYVIGKNKMIILHYMKLVSYTLETSKKEKIGIVIDNKTFDWEKVKYKKQCKKVEALFENLND